MDLNPPPFLSTPDSDAARRDADIVAWLEQGDGAAAFERLVARYEGKVHRLCMVLLRDEAQARDAAQDVFLRVWRALGTYDRHRAAPSTWLYAIARNRCLSLLARRDSDHASLSVPEVWAEAEALVAPPDIVGEGPTALLARLVDALPVAYRSCLTLFYYEDRSVAEVAQMLGLPDGTVKTHLHRARKLLLAEFQRRGLDEPGLWL